MEDESLAISERRHCGMLDTHTISLEIPDVAKHEPVALLSTQFD